jgi:RNA polymerase sigma factor (sigma-70 family)
METDTKSDIELVEASRRGETEAFGQLVARYQDVICAVSYSSIGDRSLSEDVAQETFIAAWSQLDRLRDTFRLRPWLCGIARNIARKARKRTRREELGHDEDLPADDTPFEDAARAESERVVRAALARIHTSYREVLVLHYRENQSIREIAATLGTSEAAVMQKLSRARRALAERIEQLVESSLRGQRRQRDLVAGVLAAIVLIPLPSRVEASPLKKGSTVYKFALAASAVAVVGATAYGISRHYSSSAHAAVSASTSTSSPETLHFGGATLGLAHRPTLGPTAAPRGAIRSRSIAIADLGYLPTDAEAVIGINFAQARETGIWKRFIEPELADEKQLFTSACGFDPFSSIGSLVIGAKQVGPGHSPTGVVVVHGLDKTKAMACFDQRAISELESAGAHVTVDGSVVLVDGRDGGVGAGFTFIDDETAVLVVAAQAPTKEDVLAVAAGKGSLATTSVFAETLHYVNTDDSMWLMLANGSPVMDLINTAVKAYSPVKLGTFYVAVNLSDNVALDAGLRLDTPQNVASVVAVIKQKLGEGPIPLLIAKYFDQLDVTADGSDLILSLAASGNQLAELANKDAPVQVDVEVD